MLIAALLFDDLTPLDIVGPLEVLARARTTARGRDGRGLLGNPAPER